MKTVQVIGGACMSAFDVFSGADDPFDLLFLSTGQHIEVAEDVLVRLGEAEASLHSDGLWAAPVAKSESQRVHGALFLGLMQKKVFVQTRKNKTLQGLEEVGLTHKPI